MTVTMIDDRSAAGAFRGWLDQAGARLSGPGGYYNAGNAIGLGMGIALQVGSVPAGGSDMTSAFAAAADYLAGNAGAVGLTAATAVFFLSGEAYHRAWAQGAPPVAALNRRGDYLSGIGALLLAVALAALGQWMLAVTAGLLHAIGKFGSAYKWRTVPGWRSDWPDFYRSAVLASRVPALLAALAAFLDALARADAGTPWAALLAPATLLVCYALWSRADLMLFNASAAPSGGDVADGLPSH